MHRRFIAGAVCIQCNAQDKIFVYQQDDQDIAECAQCGDQQVRPDKTQDTDNGQTITLQPRED